MFQIAALDPARCIAYAQGCVLILWRGTPSLANVPAIPTVIRAASARRGGPVGLFVVIGAESQMPESAVRDALARGVKEAAACTRFVVAVIEGEGFRTTAMRTVVVGLSLVVKQRFPSKIAATVMEGATWAAPLLSE